MGYVLKGSDPVHFHFALGVAATYTTLYQDMRTFGSTCLLIADMLRITTKEAEEIIKSYSNKTGFELFETAAKLRREIMDLHEKIAPKT